MIARRSTRLLTAFSLVLVATLAATSARAEQDWTTTPSGLKYRIVEKGSGPLPKPGQVVEFHYVGSLEDGAEFGNSRERGSPSGFRLGGDREQVLAGWKEALALMHVGDKAEFLVPPALGFGDRKQGRIPPNSTLLYRIELLAVKDNNLAEDLDEAMAKSGVDAGKKLYEQAKAAGFAKHYVGEAHMRGLGKAYLEAQRFPEAIAFAQWNVEQFPKSAQARADLAEAIFASGQLDLALKAYQDALQMDASNTRSKQQIDLIDKPVEMQFADMNGQAVDITRYRGRVVLIDMWATWCPPCVAEIPNRVSAFKKYHKKGFEIVSVSFDIAPTDPPNPRVPAQSGAQVKGFADSKKMFWPIHYDGKGFKNKFAEQFGVEAIPASFLLDTNGKIVAVNLRGATLDAALKELSGK